MNIEMSEAHLSVSNLIDLLVNGAEMEIVITREGMPVARLLPVERLGAGPRIGIAKGKFTVPDSIDDYNDLIAELFIGRES